MNGSRAEKFQNSKHSRRNRKLNAIVVTSYYVEKYGNEEDDEEIDIKDLGKRVQKGKKKTSVTKQKKETPIKGGRVFKRNK